MRMWFPKRQPKIILKEKIFEQNSERDEFNRRLYEKRKKLDD